LLLSLLKQFVQEQSSLPESVGALHKKHNSKRTRPSIKEIEEVLFSVLTHYSRAFIVVDALDECGISDNGRTQFLASTFNLQAKTRANILATSRNNDDIAKLFNSALSLQIWATNEDVESYLDAQMSLLQSDTIDNELLDQVRKQVVSAVNGMYANIPIKTNIKTF
jgi:hypothetical protein